MSKPDLLGKGIPVPLRRKNLKKMGLAALFVFQTGVAFAQPKNLTITHQGSLKELFAKIEKNSDYLFFYYDGLLDKHAAIAVNMKEASVEKVLQQALKNTSLTYVIKDNQIVIKNKEEQKKPVTKKETAKERQVTGVVTDQNGEPVIGANVIVKGSKQGTVTDIDGRFALDAPENAVLQVSYIGFAQKEVPTRDTDFFNIRMAEDAKAIDEVIVVAYGTAKKSSFTGSTAVLKKDKIEKVQTSNISNALEGALAGVQVVGSSGQPGTGATIRVRGVGSINASSSPLYIVDGVPFEGSINSINPSDIESMSVLKDAAAGALYGARGANGVILITTKKGQKGKINITFDGKVGVNSAGIPLYDKIDNAGDYYEIYWEALRNKMVFANNMSYGQAGFYASNNLISGESGLVYNAYDVDPTRVIDPLTGRLNPLANQLYNDSWKDEMLKSGLRQEYQMTLSGGNDKSDYFFSLGYLNDEGYIAASDFERFSGRMNLNHSFNKWLKVGGNMSYAHTTTNAPSTGSASSVSMFSFVNDIAPIYPVYMRDENGGLILDENGNKIPDFGEKESDKRPFNPQANPLGTQTLDLNETMFSTFSGRAYAEVTFMKGLDFKVNFGYDEMNGKGTFSMNPRYGQGASEQVGGSLTKSVSQTRSFYQNTLLNYSGEFGKHGVEAMLGHESTWRGKTTQSGSKRKFFLDETTELNGAIIYQSLSSEASDYAVEGYLSRLNYNYDNRYYVSGSYRRDGSSRFKKENRWGNFWSASASWRISQEKFMQPTSGWLDDLKLKVSYGTQGNDNVSGDVPYLTLYSVDNNNGDFSLTQITQGNDNITWEKNHNFNAGFEARFFNKLNVTLEYFNRKTLDLLFMVPRAPSTGINSVPENVGDMRNQGFELDLDYQVVNTKDWSFNVGLNATHFKNTILKLPANNRENGIITGNRLMREGASIYNLYMFEYAGVDPENGAAQYWADVVKDGETTRVKVNNTDRATRYEVGSSIPDLYGGVNFSARYRQWDLSVITNYQIGGQLIDADYLMAMGDPKTGYNYHKDIFNRWTPDNRYTDVPRLQDGNSAQTGVVSTRFLTTASYFNLKNVSFGYTFDRNLLQRIGVE
ncbi:MAG: TonB-dependent receptor, partial [Bacteroidales bacterium]